MTRRGRGAVAAVIVAVAASACASAVLRPPRGPWAPDPAGAPAFEAAAAACLGARTMTAEIAISGRAGASRLRGRVLAGFERPGRIRLEGVAPFGAPVFILAGRDNRATLLLPRDRRVLADAAVDDVLEALTGIRRGADDLAAMLGGCLVSRPVAGAIQRNPQGWWSVAIGDGLSAFLRRDGAAWRLVAGERVADGTGARSWVVHYGEFVSAFPSLVRLQEGAAPEDAGRARIDLTLRVSQRDVNVPVDASAFDVKVPPDAAPIGLDELRQMGPLAERDGGRSR